MIPDRNDALMPESRAPYPWPERNSKPREAEAAPQAIDSWERDPQTMSQHRDRIGRLFDAIGMAEVRR